MARTSPYDPMTEEDKLGWDKTTTKQGIGAARAAYAAQNPPNPPPPQPPARPVDRPTWGASMGNYGTETPMTRVGGVPTRQAEANRIGYDVAATRPLIQQQQQGLAAERARQQATLNAQEAALRSTQPGGANYVGTPNRPDAPPLSKYQQESVDRITQQLGQLNSMQERMGGYFSPENRQFIKDLEAARLDIYNRPGDDTPLDQVRGLMDRVGTVLGEKVGVGKQKLGEAIDAGREKLADGMQAASEALEPKTSETPGAETKAQDADLPGAEGEQQRSLFGRAKEQAGLAADRARRVAEGAADRVVGTKAGGQQAEINQALKRAETSEKAAATLEKRLGRMSAAEAQKVLDDPDARISDTVRERLQGIVDSGAPEKGVLRRGVERVVGVPGRVADTTVGRMTRPLAPGLAKAGGLVGAIGLGGVLGRNISEEGVGGGLRKTGEQTVEGLVDRGNAAVDIAQTLPWQDTLKQGAMTVGEDILGGLSAAGKTLGAAGAYAAEKFNGQGRPFNEIYDEVMAQPDALGLDALAQRSQQYRQNELQAGRGLNGARASLAPPEAARPETAVPPVPPRNAPETLQRGMTRADLGVTGQRQPFSSYGAGGQWMGLGGEAKAVPGLENYFGEGKPWTTADSDRLIATQLAERNTPEALLRDQIAQSQIRFNNAVNSTRATMSDPNNWAEVPVRNEDGTISLERVAPNMLGFNQVALEQLGALDRSNVGAVQNLAGAASLRQGLQGTRDQMKLDAKIAEQADKLLADYFDAENPNKREAATTKLTGIMENDPQSPLAMALMTRAANLSQQNLGPLEGMLADTANTPFGTTNPMAFEGPLTEQTGNWFDPNGYYDRNGNFVGNPDDLLDPAQQQQLRTLYNLYNQQRYGGSDPQANAGPTAEELMALAQEQQELDKANRKRSGLRRQQGEQWLQQMLYA